MLKSAKCLSFYHTLVAERGFLLCGVFKIRWPEHIYECGRRRSCLHLQKTDGKQA